MRIKIDYDKTVESADWPNVGQPVEGAIESIKLLQREHTLILDTCRTGEALSNAVAFLEAQGIEFDYVNENDPYLIDKYGDTRKISADISIDDKNLFTPLDDRGCVVWDKVMDILFY